jgi:predicted ribosome quality control (RQC) complex YloA/Tae2 family protein
VSLSAEEIAEVVAELKGWAGAVVQRAFAPERRTAVLQLRSPGRTEHLLLSAEADLTRLHRVAERPRPPGAPAPFQAALRAEIEGLRLEAIAQLPGERVVVLHLAGRHRRRLVAELLGRHGNLLLLDEAGRVLHLAGPNLSRRRDNRPGRTYVPPEPRPGVDAARRSRFTGAAAEPADALPVNRAVEAAYAPLARQKALDAHRRILERPLQAALGRIDRALSRLEAEAARAAEAETWRRYGELLKPVLHQVEKGATTARVVDWYAEGTPEVEIPLEPELSPKENLERFFHRYRRLEAAPDRIAARQAALGRARPAILGLLEALEAASDETALEAVAESAVAAGHLRPEILEAAADGGPPASPAAGRSDGGERRPYHVFRSVTGRDILVGRGSSDNDALTFKVARGNDVWIHVRGQAGSHVVVPTAGRGEPDEQTLLDAATLAAHFSRARGETVVDVAWTQRKHVRKPKGSPPGRVLVSQERGLMLRLEPERLERLLAGGPPGGGAPA